MGRPAAPKAQRARVIKAVLTDGLSLRAAAAKCGVTAPTAKRWVDAERATRAHASALAAFPPLVPIGEPEPAPEGPPPPPPPPGAPVLDTMRWLLAELVANVVEAKQAHNHTAASAAGGHLAKLGTLIKQLEKAASADADGIRVTHAQLQAADESVRAKIAALAARPGLRCADCGRALAVLLAGYDPKAIEEGRKKGH